MWYKKRFAQNNNIEILKSQFNNLLNSNMNSNIPIPNLIGAINNLGTTLIQQQPDVTIKNQIQQMAKFYTDQLGKYANNPNQTATPEILSSLMSVSGSENITLGKGESPAEKLMISGGAQLPSAGQGTLSIKDVQYYQNLGRQINPAQNYTNPQTMNQPQMTQNPPEQNTTNLNVKKQKNSGEQNNLPVTQAT